MQFRYSSSRAFHQKASRIPGSRCGTLCNPAFAAQAPLVVLESADGRARVVLENVHAVGLKEVADAGEWAAMQQIGSALDEAVAGRELLAERQEAALCHAVVGEVGIEIVERLRGPI